VGDRRELRHHCKLAARIAGAQLRDGLKQRLAVEDPGVSRRALLMLAALRRPRLNTDQVARARQVILDGARRQDVANWLVPSWVGQLTHRFWSDEWGQQLAILALGYGETRKPALRILERAPHFEIDASHRAALTALLLADIDRGEERDGFASLAPLLDTPELRNLLTRRKEHPTRRIRERARWALNDIVACERRTDP
jgi:hypothetical protein